MASYLQMGFASDRLFGRDGIPGFAGAILSPLNRTPDELKCDVAKYRAAEKGDLILDPQIYSPTDNRGKLPDYPYFPKDIDTSDQSSSVWWKGIAKSVAKYADEIGVDAVCSPCMIPAKWTPDYYRRSVEAFWDLEASVATARAMLTLCVHLTQLSDVNDALRIASMVTSGETPSECYLVIASDVEPRRELTDSAGLTGVMALIAALERAGCSVLVSHCSTDVLLMKAAGSSHCASGKFFNLRRFNKNRFIETDEGGGGQLSYWFEHSLMAFLLEADLASLRKDGLADLIGVGPTRNKYSDEIQKLLQEEPGSAWVGLSWRQYLAWFTEVEFRLSSDPIPIVNKWLVAADSNWEQVEDKDIIFQQRRNDGRWIRAWRKALSDFKKLEY